jgi:hypothetical protein
MAPAFPYRLSVVDDDPALWEVAYARVSLTDLIISDLRMPNMNGSEFLSVVRRRFSTIPLIVISGEFTGSTFQRACLPKRVSQKDSTDRRTCLPRLKTSCANCPPGQRWANPTRVGCNYAQSPYGRKMLSERMDQRIQLFEEAGLATDGLSCVAPDMLDLAERLYGEMVGEALVAAVTVLCCRGCNRQLVGPAPA